MSLRTFATILLLWLFGAVLGCDSRESPRSPGPASRPASGTTTAPASGGGYAGVDSCVECHKEAYEAWRGSHHAHAMRNPSPALDDEAFSPERIIRHGTQTSAAKLDGGRYTLTLTGRDGQRRDYQPTGVIGVAPLWQYLIPDENGRLQVTEVAFDPAKKEWFNVYGEEDRRHWEWGHWSNRGMNWNSMCATCHTTNYQKNYDPVSDSYRSTYQVMGVDCEQCHGPMKDHVEWQAGHPQEENDPTIQWLDNDQYFAVCGSCHARRGDLTGRFRSGDAFFDHYDLYLPDHSDVFYPDGQVRDEDFEYACFMLSYMQAMGVRCYTCHDSHSGKTRKEGNALCLQCHERKMTTRIAIDPVEHSHHPPDKPGFLCVDCHMPQTVYMARHWRHDHGMTIPDPLLTKEHGIPNACTRCHVKEGLDWSIDYVAKWYGRRMDRPTRRRAGILARVKAGNREALPGLLALVKEEANPAWLAVYARFLGPVVAGGYDTETVVSAVQSLTSLADHASPLVQACAIDALAPVAVHLADQLAPKLDDPARLVRVKAAWAFHRFGNLPKRASDDLVAYLRFNEDQPTGAFQQANYLAETNRPQESLGWFEKAIQWDSQSAPFRHGYAVVLSQLGRLDEALLQLAKASDLDSNEAFYPYSMGLLYAEMGRMTESRDALRAAVARAPNQGRFWYNLALAEDRLGSTDAAIEAMLKAEDLEPNVPDYPYALATIYVKLQKRDLARRSLERVLRIDPNHQEARRLMASF